MIQYWQTNSGQMINLIFQHAKMVLCAILIALTVAIGLIVLFLSKNNWLSILTHTFSLIYSVPSYAFFALLIPITGLGMKSAVIVLAFYSEYILLRTFITGIREIDSAYLEIAKGLGMTDQQIFIKVQLPLALPAIFSGLQIALASTMAIATIASTISAGGLGDLLFEGLQTGRVVPILWGTILTIALTLLCIIFLKFIKNIMVDNWYDVKRGVN